MAKTMKTIPLILLFTLVPCSRGGRGEPVVRLDLAPGKEVEPATRLNFAACKDNAAIDGSLRKASPLYNAMARIVPS